MKRRLFLAAAGAGMSSITGCLTSAGGQSPTEEPTRTPPATPESTPPQNAGGLEDVDPKTTYERVEVGSREGVKEDFRPHDILIWNTLSSEQSISVRILDRLAETTAHWAEYSVPADEAVQIRLLTPSKYYIQLWGPAIESPETLLVPCRRFDCNNSATRIGLFETGEVRSGILTTLAECPSPEC